MTEILYMFDRLFEDVSTTQLAVGVAIANIICMLLIVKTIRDIVNDTKKFRANRLQEK